jgi:16S rRNA (guanine1516-N2)-methyltransferase
MPASLAKHAIASEETLGITARGFSFALEDFEGRLQLRALHRPDFGPICADWLGSEMKRRIAGGRKQLLARAVGFNKKPELHILDATAGLGRDGFTLAALGAHVTMIERHPQIFALLKDAQSRALHDPLSRESATRVSLIEQDARAALRAGSWDVIYLDPMYPHLGKAALPQKEMQIFRDLTAGDPDGGELLPMAIQAARKRVVVKRAAKAPCLASLEPSFTLSGGQARFDVYLSNTACAC